MKLKLKKWQIALIGAAFFLLASNPTISDFKGYVGESAGPKKTANFFLFSIFQYENDRYFGIARNFFEIHRQSADAVASDSTATAAPDTTATVARDTITKTDEPHNLQFLYKKLHDAELYTKSFGEFKKQFSNRQKIDVLYDRLYRAGYYTKSKADFYAQYFPYQR